MIYILIGILLLFCILMSIQHYQVEQFENVFDALQVYSSPFDKIRVGNQNDGGYVICKELEYDNFLSAGISNDISFEEHFLALYPNLKCYAFDGTIHSLPQSTNDRIIWAKKNIGGGETEHVTNLHNFLNTHNSLFIKMDIEGGEYEWIESLTETQLRNIKQLVIEFHNPLKSANRMRCIQKLVSTHWLVHFHANNYEEVDVIGSFTIPRVFECTYIHKELAVNNLKCNENPIPDNRYDNPNNPSREDIPLSDFPYMCRK